MTLTPEEIDAIATKVAEKLRPYLQQTITIQPPPWPHPYSPYPWPQVWSQTGGMQA